MAKSGLKLAAARTIDRISVAENGSTSARASGCQSGAPARVGLLESRPASTAWSRIVLSTPRPPEIEVSVRSARSSAIRRLIESRLKYSDVTGLAPSFGSRCFFRNHAFPFSVEGCSFRVCAYSFIASSATWANVGTAFTATRG